MHSDLMSYHNDIIMIPTAQECRELDPLIDWDAERVVKADGLVREMDAEIRVSDSFDLYIILKPRKEDL